jgi:hypothetical protein
MVILGISEHPKQLQDSIGGASSVPIHPQPEPIEVEESGMETSLPTMVTTPNSYAGVAAPENCSDKVYVFCEKVLNIKDARSCIRINRAHRSPSNPITGKTRPIIINFDTDSKILVKVAFKSVKLKDTPYSVFDQLPKEVQARRKQLIRR